MSRPSHFALGLFLVPALCVLSLNAQTTGTVDGLLRDATGSALPGIPLTLTASGLPAASLHATTDRLGAFHFDHLAAGTYVVSTDRSGDSIAPNAPLVVSDSASALHLTLTLTTASPKPQGLQLQAAGIRGYIDPGGYSAPAGAAAATKLIQGAADLNRTGNTTADAAILCQQEPALLKASLDHPADAAAQRELGRYYLAARQPEKALPNLQRAWTLDKHDAKTLPALAEALLQNRQFTAAHDLLAADPAIGDQAQRRRLLARSEEGLGAFQQAAHEYEAAAALDPTEADFYGVGYELILAGSARAAVDAFKDGIKRYPGSTTLLTGLGTADFLLGQTTEATRIFLRGAILHPDDARLYPFLSASFAISGDDPDAAGAAFRRFYEISPGNADAAYFYALFLLHRSQTNPPSVDPATLLQHAIDLQPGFAKAHLQLGSIYLDRGDSTHAIGQFTTALRLEPEQWETHYRLSTAYRRAGQTALADQQMQLFLAHKNQTSNDNQPSDVHLEDFLSVFTRAAPATPCAALK